MTRKLRVSEINVNSQAEQLGIKTGDFIVSYNDVPVYKNDDLSNAISLANNKNIAKRNIEILRGDSKLSFEASMEPLGVNCVDTHKRIDNSALEQDTTYNSTEYGLARSMCSAVMFIGWVFIALGVVSTFVLFFTGLNSEYGGLSLLSILPGIGIIVTGLFLIVTAQVTKATVDNADHTREILKILSKDNKI